MFTKRGLAIEYVRRFPNTPSLTLAKKIYAENKEVYVSIESVRDIIKTIRGAHGKRERKYIVQGLQKKGVLNPFESIPEGIKSFGEWEAYHIPDERTLCLFDLHVPFHDKKALCAALEFARDRVDSVLIQEAFDFYQLSTFEKDPRNRHTKEEVKLVNEVLFSIKKYLKPKHIYYQRGNHCDRWMRYLKVKAPELLDMELVKFEYLFDESLGIQVTPDRKIVKFGNLNCVHGHEFGNGIFEPVNPARGLFLRGGESSIAGHWHRTSNHSARSMTDKIISCWTVGCLCDLHAEYRPMNNWNHGFAIIERLPHNAFIVKNFRIINGKVYS